MFRSLARKAIKATVLGTAAYRLYKFGRRDELTSDIDPEIPSLGQVTPGYFAGTMAYEAFIWLWDRPEAVRRWLKHLPKKTRRAFMSLANIIADAIMYTVHLSRDKSDEPSYRTHPLFGDLAS